MVRQIKVLDLFCGVGGATHGYQRVGFHVTGVDISEQPSYVGEEFIHGDSLSYLVKSGHLYNFIHASPPCQNFSAYRRRDHMVGLRYPNLIQETRNLLDYVGVPYVIENIRGAPLYPNVQLCGSSFGLDIRRHRDFESPLALTGPDCFHEWQTSRFPPAGNRENLRSTVEIGAWRIPLETQKHAMDMHWPTTVAELTEAIPPAYTEHLGVQIACLL